MNVSVNVSVNMSVSFSARRRSAPNCIELYNTEPPTESADKPEAIDAEGRQAIRQSINHPKRIVWASLKTHNLFLPRKKANALKAITESVCQSANLPVNQHSSVIHRRYRQSSLSTDLSIFLQLGITLPLLFGHCSCVSV